MKTHCVPRLEAGRRGGDNLTPTDAIQERLNPVIGYTAASY